MLASMLVAAVSEAGETLVVPTDLQIERKNPDDFHTYFLNLATKSYPQYGILQQLQLPGATEEDPKAREARRDNEIKRLAETAATMQ